jgi:hypothetical protein
MQVLSNDPCIASLLAPIHTYALPLMPLRTRGQAAGWIYAISQLGRLACGVFIYVAIEHISHS